MSVVESGPQRISIEILSMVLETYMPLSGFVRVIFKLKMKLPLTSPNFKVIVGFSSWDPTNNSFGIGARLCYDLLFECYHREVDFIYFYS